MRNYIWVPSYQNELYHFGVKGMKWGVRKDRKYSDGSYGRTGKAIQKAYNISGKGTARAYQRSMNKLARISGESKSRQADHAEKFNRLVDKRNNALERGKTKKAAKLESKAWKRMAKVATEGENAKAAAAKWAKLGADVVERGYNLNMRPVTYYSSKANRGRMVAHSLLGMYGSIAVSVSHASKDKKYRESHNTDYSPYAYDTLKAKVRRPKQS